MIFVVHVRQVLFRSNRRNGLPGFVAAMLSLWLILVVAASAGAQTRFSDGDLLQVRGDEKMHLVQAGRRRWIADTTSLRRLNPDFGRLKQVTFEELDAIPAGKPYRQLPLLRDHASGRVYLVTWETDSPAPRKHWINDLQSFSKLGFEWGDIDQNAGVLPSQVADAPSLSYRPPSKEETTWEHDGVSLKIVPAWRHQVEDERLYLALALANTYNNEWREQVAPKLTAQGAWIEWTDLPAYVGGKYDVDLNRISMSRALQKESDGVIASILSHETFHVVSTHGTAEACYTEEISAFGLGARTWETLPARWRPLTEWGKSLDALVEAWKSGALSNLVRGDLAYQQQCGGP